MGMKTQVGTYVTYKKGFGLKNFFGTCPEAARSRCRARMLHYSVGSLRHSIRFVRPTPNGLQVYKIKLLLFLPVPV